MEETSLARLYTTLKKSGFRHTLSLRQQLHLCPNSHPGSCDTGDPSIVRNRDGVQTQGSGQTQGHGAVRP